jgi:formate dehydrogenase major subunit
MSSTKIPDIKYVPTTCPYCGVGCGLNLIVNDGKLVGVEPNKRSPINEGKLCPKGATCWEFVHSPDRLTKPLIKKGDKFEEASWEEALSLITSKFKETSDKFGPKSLGFQVSCRTPNEDCYIMQKAVRARPTISTTAPASATARRWPAFRSPSDRERRRTRSKMS